VPVGPATGELGTPTPPAATPRPVARAKGLADNLGRFVTLVLGAAVMLGIGGATGLYLTRHPHEH